MYRNTRSHGFRSRRKSGAGFFMARGKYINPARFINKPTEKAHIQEYVPTHTFDDFQLPKILTENIRKKSYVMLTPIQDKAIQPIRDGKDVIGIANTGTGKTAAFLIPLIEKMLADATVKCLIITPTRELAVQIQDEFRSFAQGTNLNSVLIIGGSNIDRQRTRIRGGYNVLIATPGRLIDHVKKNAITLSSFTKIVLDEVDRMVDIGFI